MNDSVTGDKSNLQESLTQGLNPNDTNNSLYSPIKQDIPASSISEKNLEEEDEDIKALTRSRGFIAQFRAIILKNAALQSKQKGTNICQVLTPIICLGFIYLIKTLVSGDIGSGLFFELSVPYLYNVPYEKIYGYSSPFLNHSQVYLYFSTCLQYYLYDFDHATQETQDFVGDYFNGMLANTFPPISFLKDQYYCYSYDMNMPFFVKPQNGTINNQLYENLRYLDSVPWNSVPDMHVVPDGAVTFYEASPNNLTFKVQIDDVRVAYRRTNGVSRYSVYMPEADSHYTSENIYDGQLILTDLITKSYMQTIRDDVWMLSGSIVMPTSTTSDALFSQIISLIGASLYPIAISLLLPIFMYAIVLEKEERLREIMKMNGLKMANYWMANYLWSIGLYILSITIFILIGRFGLKLDFFVDTSIWVLIVSFLGWGLSQVSLAFFFQNFFSKAKTAIIGGYLLSMWTTLVGVTYATGAYPLPRELPVEMRIYPPFAMTRLFYILSYSCYQTECLKGFDKFTSEMWSCVIVMYVGAVFFVILGLYLDEVLPSEFGIRKHPLYFLSFFSKGKSSGKKGASFVEDNHAHGLNIDENDNDKEDDDVKAETNYIDSLEEPLNKHPLIIKHLRKVYKAVGGKPPKTAVKNFSLHIKKGEMFGLLGPNGAGKTSLISMLTGLYPPENGNAWIGGYDIQEKIDLVHTQMGVCPQFDLVWPELSVREHLEFYARIREVPRNKEKMLVEKALKEVYLTKFADFGIKQLSGGMKRRLSVAIAMVGDPKIIFLDEPTTGLDPENRRQLWDILAEARGKKAIMLTTHSMEEADVLCTRIGIITEGRLRCIGPQTRLKARYGSGYHLYINCHRENDFNIKRRSNSIADRHHVVEENWVKVENYMKETVPKAVLKSSFNGCFIYLVPVEGLKISGLFAELEAKKTELGIADWGISQATLEDVFMEVVESTESKDAEEDELVR